MEQEKNERRSPGVKCDRLIAPARPPESRSESSSIPHPGPPRWNTSPGTAASIPQSSTQASDSASSAPTIAPMPSSSPVMPSARPPEPNSSAPNRITPSGAWRPVPAKPGAGSGSRAERYPNPPSSSKAHSTHSPPSNSPACRTPTSSSPPPALRRECQHGSPPSASRTSHADTTQIPPEIRPPSVSSAQIQTSGESDPPAKRTGTTSCNHANATLYRTLRQPSEHTDPGPGAGCPDRTRQRCRRAGSHPEPLHACRERNIPDEKRSLQ